MSVLSDMTLADGRTGQPKKNKGDGYGHRVQMRHEADDQCQERKPDETFRPVEQTAHPSVRPPERGPCGTHNGGWHNTELAGVSARIDIMEEEQYDKQHMGVQPAGRFRSISILS